MRKPRKNYTPVEKVAILRRHLLDHVPVSDLCDEHQLSPTLFYTWQGCNRAGATGFSHFPQVLALDPARVGHLGKRIA
jgi:transposase-like protein